MGSSTFLLIMTLLLLFVSILKSALANDKAIRINRHYHVYKINKIHEDYDFEALLARERKYYPIATLISLAAYLLTLFTNNILINNTLVVLVIGVLGFSIYYLRPQKYNEQT